MVLTVERCDGVFAGNMISIPPDQMVADKALGEMGERAK
jgi:hypothetical protein